MIYYSLPSNKDPRDTHFQVYLEKKYIGRIVRVNGGFCYVTKDGSANGEIFPTVRQVKDSLERKQGEIFW